jgi:hypothetical protein
MATCRSPSSHSGMFAGVRQHSAACIVGCDCATSICLRSAPRHEEGTACKDCDAMQPRREEVKAAQRDDRPACASEALREEEFPEVNGGVKERWLARCFISHNVRLRDWALSSHARASVGNLIDWSTSLLPEILHRALYDQIGARPVSTFDLPKPRRPRGCYRVLLYSAPGGLLFVHRGFAMERTLKRFRRQGCRVSAGK